MASFINMGKAVIKSQGLKEKIMKPLLNIKLIHQSWNYQLFSVPIIIHLIWYCTDVNMSNCCQSIYRSRSFYIHVNIYLSISHQFRWFVYLFKSIYICISIYLHMYIYVSTYVYLCIYICISIYLHMYIYLSTYIYLPIYICISIYLSTTML